MQLIHPQAQIKIISDGTPFGTKVIDIETNKEIINISMISIKIQPNRFEANLLLLNVPIEIEGIFRVGMESE